VGVDLLVVSGLDEVLPLVLFDFEEFDLVAYEDFFLVEIADLIG
jgi:hypothetical protein